MVAHCASAECNTLQKEDPQYTVHTHGHAVAYGCRNSGPYHAVHTMPYIVT